MYLTLLSFISETGKYLKEKVAGIFSRTAEIWHHQRFQKLCYVSAGERRISNKRTK